MCKYGLKQAPRTWHHCFAHFLFQTGFVVAKSDNSLFTFCQGNDMAYLPLYVDDIILWTSFNALRDRIISHLKFEFPMSDLRPLSYFLGVSVTRTPSYMLLSLKKYALEILERAGMCTCKPVATLIDTTIDTNSKLSVDSGHLVADLTHYRSLACALQY